MSSFAQPILPSSDLAGQREKNIPSSTLFSLTGTVSSSETSYSCPLLRAYLSGLSLISPYGGVHSLHGATVSEIRDDDALIRAGRGEGDEPVLEPDALPPKYRGNLGDPPEYSPSQQSDEEGGEDKSNESGGTEGDVGEGDEWVCCCSMEWIRRGRGAAAGRH